MAFLSVLRLNLIQMQSREISKGLEKQQNQNLCYCGRRILVAEVEWSIECSAGAECRSVLGYCWEMTLAGYGW